MKVQRNKPSTAISVVLEPGEFFKEKVIKAFEKNKIDANESIEYYLVNLLAQFMFSENLFATDSNGNRQEEVLALLLNKALLTADSDSRNANLRRLGDVSLYTAGFFSDSLSRKMVDVDYYIGMGKSAYSHLAQTTSVGTKKHIFNELGARFHKYVDVLNEVSESTGNKNARDLLRIYDLWLKTRSEKAEKSLKEAGIIPNLLLKPDNQQ